MTKGAKESRHHRLHDQVVRQLALRILRDEELIPGTGLPTEVELSKELKVSRTIPSLGHQGSAVE